MSFDFGQVSLTFGYDNDDADDAKRGIQDAIAQVPWEGTRQGKAGEEDEAVSGGSQAETDEGF